MSILDALRYRLGALRHPARHARDIEREMDLHLALDAADRVHEAAGRLSDDEAQFAARRQFGNPTYLREEARRMTAFEWLDTVQRDLTFAARSFRRSPGFTATVVLTLALGIGANTAIFSALHAMLLRPLPFAQPDRLMEVSLTRPGNGVQASSDDIVWSVPKFQLLEQAQHVFSELGAYSADPVTVSGAADAQRVDGEAVAGRYFETLGVQPVLGRLFLPEEIDRPAGPAAVLISEALWQRRFAADPTVLGRTLDIDGKPHTIIGVMPGTFAGLSGRAQVWMPIATEIPVDFTEAWDLSYSVVARLAPGITGARAISDVRAIGVRIDAATPYFMGHEHWGATARFLDAKRVDPVIRRSLFVLSAAAGFVLLIACANIAGLLLVRAERREREIAVRLAIGAGRRRLVRQLVTESLLLAAFGGVGAIGVAGLGVRALEVLNPASPLRLQHIRGLGVVEFSTIRLDPAALAFIIALVALTGLLFGLWPAMQATRPTLVEGLKRIRGRARRWRAHDHGARGLLSIIEIALAVVLLAGSGLMLHSLWKLIAVDPGFDPAHVLTMRFNPLPDSADPRGISRFYERLLMELRGGPAVTGVALASCPPLNGGCNRTWVDFPDRAPVEPVDRPLADVHWVTRGWFAVARVPLVAGRDFAEGDVDGARRVVIVNQTAARRFWPGQDPIGRPVRLGQGGFSRDTGWVIGVVGDVHYESLNAPAGSAMYLPFAQSTRTAMMVFIRTGGNPEALRATAERVARSVDPRVPAYDVRTLAARSGDATVQARFGAVLLSAFAGVALLLAMIGIYGIISSEVAMRMREIGIRMALGATPGQVLRIALADGVLLALVGATLGLALALSSNRFLQSLLFDVAPTDPVALLAAIGLLVASAIAAGIIPARRATRVDPAVVLRDE